MRIDNYKLLIPLGIATIVHLIGCASSRSPTSADTGAHSDTGTSVPRCDGACSSGRHIDLLLVLEDQGSHGGQILSVVSSMARELGTLAALSGADVHIAVVSSDVGIARSDVMSCSQTGDDGLLLRGDGACGPVIRVTPTSTAADLEQQMRCRLDGDDCGFEQPLESMLKSITPSSSDIVFARSVGHSDGANAGFLRPDSILAIMLFATENDCSASDLELFAPESAAYSGALDLRCFEHASALHQLSRYVDGVLAVRPPEQMSVFAIVGLPQDLSGRSTTDILSDSRMVEELDPTVSNRLRPACQSDVLAAMPGRRQVEFADALAARGVRVGVHSVCDPNAREIVLAAREQFERTFCAACISSE